MLFSVVIATKDREQALHQTLVALQAQHGAPPFEVIVVDNGSTDGTKRVVEMQANANTAIRYVLEPRPNRGKARNRGVDAAVGQYILFCDDDVALPEGWIAAHAAAHAGGDRVVNGPILNVATPKQRPLPRATNYSRAFLCSCNASLSKRAFLTVGGFDEGFNLYGWEDTELGVRLRQCGLGWKFAWNAYLWHIKPTEQSLAIESGKAVEKARMARRFLTKHPSYRARLATGAYWLNRLRGRYLLPDWLLALYAGLSTNARMPPWIAGLTRNQLLDGIYTRELVRVLGARDDG